jgi:hypothetical protein
MKLTIELSLAGGEAIPSSEVTQDGHNTVHDPKTPDTRQATLRHMLEAAVAYVTRRAQELSQTEIKDLAWGFKAAPRPFGEVTVSAVIKE